jgi:hypothetical protein
LAEEKKGLTKTPCCWDGKKEETGSSFFSFSSPVTFSVCKIPMLTLEERLQMFVYTTSTSFSCSLGIMIVDRNFCLLNFNFSTCSSLDLTWIFTGE